VSGDEGKEEEGRRVGRRRGRRGKGRERKERPYSASPDPCRKFLATPLAAGLLAIARGFLVINR